MLLNKNTNIEYKKENKENKENINYINKNIDNIDNINDKNIKNDNFKKDNKIYSKEELKNIKYLTKLLSENNPDLYQQLEDFEYLDSGVESNVYKVTFKKSKKECVMKLIINEKRKKRNRKEIKISKKLKHKNIIDLIYHTPLNNTESDIILMEQASLGNLRNFIYKKLKRNYCSETMLCYITYQILSGLKYLQIQKIVHYDIKPANIIMDDKLNIKLIDFSVSLNYSKINTDEIKLKFSGTQFYMPPEVIKEKTVKLKDVNKIDMFSLGVLIYKFAFCCYPYNLKNEDNDYDKIYNKIMNNKLEIGSEDGEYSEFFINFLKKLLEKDITKRINIDEALEDYWIKGADILMEEKEKLFNADSFLINLLMENFYEYNYYMKK